MRRRTAPIALVLATVVLPACGGGESDERAVRRTVDQFAEAMAGKDYQRLCDDLLAPELVEKVRSVNLPCEVALKTGFEDVREPKVEVRRIVVEGRTARATVRSSAANQRPSIDDVRLVKQDGGWRIASLATPSS